MEAKQIQREVQEIKVGSIMHTSWGYDMTINDFCLVLENTGKTLKCVMVGTKMIEGNSLESSRVVADVGNVVSKPFRIRMVKYKGSEKTFYSGSYPYCAKHGTNNDTAKRLGSWKPTEARKDFYENHMD